MDRPIFKEALWSRWHIRRTALLKRSDCHHYHQRAWPPRQCIIDWPRWVGTAFKQES